MHYYNIDISTKVGSAKEPLGFQKKDLKSCHEFHARGHTHTDIYRKMWKKIVFKFRCLLRNYMHFENVF